MRLECGLLSSMKACESPEHAAKTGSMSPCWSRLLSTVKGLPFCSLGFINTTPFAIEGGAVNGRSVIPAISSDGVVCLAVRRSTGKVNTPRLVRLMSTSAYRQLSIAALSTMSLMVASDAFLANHMFLLVKNRRSVGPRIHWRAR